MSYPIKLNNEHVSSYLLNDNTYLTIIDTGFEDLYVCVVCDPFGVEQNDMHANEIYRIYKVKVSI